MKQYELIEYHDSEQIYEVLKEFNDFFVPKVKETDEELLAYSVKLAQLSHFVVALDKGRVIAFTDYYANDLETKIAFGTLIAIRPEYHDMGLFGQIALGQLFEYLKKQVKSEGYMKMRLEVYTSNTHARQLYEKAGAVYEKPASDKSIYMLMDL